MKIAFFDAKQYDRTSFILENEKFGFELKFFDVKLDQDTVALAHGYNAVCIFVNDKCDAEVLAQLNDMDVQSVLLRCAGYDRVDLAAARAMGIAIQRVPAYSPHAVAEFAVGLLLAIDRKIHLAYSRVRDGNFTLNGFEGFDLHGKTAGVVGCGKIGQCFIDIMLGFGCKVKVYDPQPNQEYESKKDVQFTTLETLLRTADFVSLHLPLLPSTKYVINENSLATMKKNAVIINTSRGGLIDTAALVTALKRGEISGAALDVYEEEDGYFFEDRSSEIILDDTLARLQNMKNVIITSHQAFFTKDALASIAQVTLENAQICFKILSELKDSGSSDDDWWHRVPNLVEPVQLTPPTKYLQSRRMVYGERRKSFIDTHTKVGEQPTP